MLDTVKPITHKLTTKTLLYVYLRILLPPPPNKYDKRRFAPMCCQFLVKVMAFLRGGIAHSYFFLTAAQKSQ